MKAKRKVTKNAKTVRSKVTTALKRATKSVKRAIARAKPGATKRASKDRYDHTFKAIYDRDIPWESDDARGLLKLPKGVQVKVLNYDPVMKRLDMKQRFPPGYVEPAHTHTSWHSILVTKGRMCVAGKDLRPGDYVFGWDIPHGPYEYPDGCEVFIVYMGDASHKWEKSDLLEHKNIWNPETEEGRRGVQAHIRKRAQDV
jgi:hypothetical protein